VKFLMIVKASKESEAGVMPSEELIARMGKYNEELVDAGMLLEATGLKPSSKGARIQYSGGKPTVIDGPFAETKELVAGFWIIQAKSYEEALDWARRAPAPQEDGSGEIELRQFFELDDFASSPAVDHARALEERVAKSKPGAGEQR